MRSPIMIILGIDDYMASYIKSNYQVDDNVHVLGTYIDLLYYPWI